MYCEKKTETQMQNCMVRGKNVQMHNYCGLINCRLLLFV